MRQKELAWLKRSPNKSTHKNLFGNSRKKNVEFSHNWSNFPHEEPTHNIKVIVAGSLLNADRTTKKHSIKSIERATKNAEGHILWTVVGH